jgi:hypothetical protein
LTYEMKECVIEGLPLAYTPSGAYIGTEEWAQELERRGIVPELRTPDSQVCSIGFCEREQKWYGWSHRAIFGFGVGSTVKKGDCAYQPTDADDFIADALNFWKDTKGFHVREWAEIGERDGEPGVWIRWQYSDTVPNEALRGTVGGTFATFPQEYGRGEWTAQTLEDARQMACDFAEGVD